MDINFVSDKRPIIRFAVNGRPANFLIDTGAAVGLIDREQMKEYSLKKGRSFGGSLTGAGGEFTAYNICDTVFEVGRRKFNQMVLSDISGVSSSIERYTGIRILGIIGVPQLRQIGAVIDISNNKMTI